MREDSTTHDLKDLMAQAIHTLQPARKEEVYRLFSKAVDLAPTDEDTLLRKADCSSDLDETILLSDPGGPSFLCQEAQGLAGEEVRIDRRNQR